MLMLLIRRDIALAFGRGGGAFASLAFFLMVFTLFAFGLGPNVLRESAAQVIVVAALLAHLLALPGLFERDNADGTLEHYLLQPIAIEWLTAAKLLAFWLTSALPLVVLSPLLALMAGVNAVSVWHIAAALFLATPSLSALGAFAAALTLGARGSGIAQALILLPLMMPVLVFAAAAASGEGQGAFVLLAAFLFFLVPACCMLAAMLIRSTSN